MDRDDILTLKDLRGIRRVCKVCVGRGTALYANTSTWRRGIGGSACTVGQCDACWGSGDADNPWPSIRDLEKKRKGWERDQCLSWLACRLGCQFSEMREKLNELAELCQKQANKRNLPEGAEQFWWRQNWEALAAVLQDIAGPGSSETV